MAKSTIRKTTTSKTSSSTTSSSSQPTGGMSTTTGKSVLVTPSGQIVGSAAPPTKTTTTKKSSGGGGGGGSSSSSQSISQTTQPTGGMSTPSGQSVIVTPQGQVVGSAGPISKPSSSSIQTSRSGSTIQSQVMSVAPQQKTISAQVGPVGKSYDQSFISRGIESSKAALNVKKIGQERGFSGYFGEIREPFNRPGALPGGGIYVEPSEKKRFKDTSFPLVSKLPVAKEVPLPVFRRAKGLSPGELAYQKDVAKGLELPGYPTEVVVAIKGERLSKELTSQYQTKIDKGEFELSSEEQIYGKLNKEFEEKFSPIAKQTRAERAGRDIAVGTLSSTAPVGTITQRIVETGAFIGASTTPAGAVGVGALAAGSSSRQFGKAALGKDLTPSQRAVYGTLGAVELGIGGAVTSSAIKSTGKGSLSLIERQNLKEFEKSIAKQNLVFKGAKVTENEKGAVIVTKGSKLFEGVGKQEVRGVVPIFDVSKPAVTARGESGAEIVLEKGRDAFSVTGAKFNVRTKYVDPVTGRVTQSSEKFVGGTLQPLTPQKGGAFVKPITSGISKKYEFDKATVGTGYLTAKDSKNINRFAFGSVSKDVEGGTIVGSFSPQAIKSSERGLLIKGKPTSVGFIKDIKEEERFVPRFINQAKVKSSKTKPGEIDIKVTSTKTTKGNGRSNIPSGSGQISTQQFKQDVKLVEQQAIGKSFSESASQKAIRLGGTRAKLIPRTSLRAGRRSGFNIATYEGSKSLTSNRFNLAYKDNTLVGVGNKLSFSQPSVQLTGQDSRLDQGYRLDTPNITSPGLAIPLSPSTPRGGFKFVALTPPGGLPQFGMGSKSKSQIRKGVSGYTPSLTGSVRYNVLGETAGKGTIKLQAGLPSVRPVISTGRTLRARISKRRK